MTHLINRRFSENDSVVSLIEADYDILPLLSRFSLPLGFGGETIARLCAASGIHPDVFLLIVNFILNGEIDVERMRRVSPLEVARFLHKSHDYYLNYKLPHIRSNLLSSLDPVHKDINPIIVKYFDDYVESVKAHFEYEEKVLFPYVERLVRGDKGMEYSADTFAHHHDHDVEDKIGELKNIILRYYTTSVPFKMYDVLVDIYNCEEDLKEHSDVENRILVPLIKRLEPKG
ncbi:MAG: hemerythrin domain-containing protein [Muribaculaceae bacterium]|nr:hemerythrin domain-containing protein [Muribaculaceae bacterium]